MMAMGCLFLGFVAGWVACALICLSRDDEGEDF